MNRIRLSQYLTVLSLLILVFTSVQAKAVTIVPRLIFVKFSYEKITEPALDKKGNVIRDANGNPVYRQKTKFDPASLDGITQIGMALTFDPTVQQVDLDPATYGFLCEFSASGVCPSSLTDFPTPDANPFGGATTPWSFTVDNTLGTANLFIDFSASPVTPNGNKDFFGFDLLTINPQVDTLQQHPESPNQFCRTITSGNNNGCSDAVQLPEPAGALLLLPALLLLRLRKNARRAINA